MDRRKSSLSLPPLGLFGFVAALGSNETSALFSRRRNRDQVRKWVVAMCDECAKLDQKIEHFEGMIARVPDPLTTERVGKLIEDIQAQKAALHPEKDGTDHRS